MSYEFENGLLRSSLDVAGQLIHKLECQIACEIPMLKHHCAALEREKKVLAREITRHNKRCRKRKRQVTKLLNQVAYLCAFNQQLVEENSMLWVQHYSVKS